MKEGLAMKELASDCARQQAVGLAEQMMIVARRKVIEVEIGEDLQSEEAGWPG
jgi:hypothetical protein